MAWRGIALRPGRGMAPWGLLIGVVFALEFVFLYQGLTRTIAARGTVLLYTAPFFVALGGQWLLGDRLTRARVAGLALAFGGVAVALADRATGAGDWRGDLMCLAAGCEPLTPLLAASSALVAAGIWLVNRRPAGR